MGCVHNLVFIKVKRKDKNRARNFYYTTNWLQNKVKVPVDPTDQVMLRLKLLDALMDMSKFLFALGWRT